MTQPTATITEASLASANDALERLHNELPALFLGNPDNGTPLQEFRVVKQRNVRSVHRALWELRQALTPAPAFQDEGNGPTAGEVNRHAQLLLEYATHFAQRDWNYTRHHKVRSLHFESLSERVKDVLSASVRGMFGRKSSLDKMLKQTWMSKALGCWRYHNHLPDGALDNGAILTFWEETGEYLQLVQPSVGALVGDLMVAHPHLPEVKAIAAELKRINDAYTTRVQSEAVPEPS